jgi:hypothetical protein
MAVEDVRVQFGQRRLHRLDLTDQVDAVSVVLDHALDTPDVALDRLEALERFGLVQMKEIPLH